MPLLLPSVACHMSNCRWCRYMPYSAIASQEHHLFVTTPFPDLHSGNSTVDYGLRARRDRRYRQGGSLEVLTLMWQ